MRRSRFDQYPSSGFADRVMKEVVAFDVKQRRRRRMFRGAALIVVLALPNFLAYRLTSPTRSERTSMMRVPGPDESATTSLYRQTGPVDIAALEAEFRISACAEKPSLALATPQLAVRPRDEARESQLMMAWTSRLSLKDCEDPPKRRLNLQPLRVDWLHMKGLHS
jgi:hypothetical protein